MTDPECQLWAGKHLEILEAESGKCGQRRDPKQGIYSGAFKIKAQPAMSHSDHSQKNPRNNKPLMWIVVAIWSPLMRVRRGTRQNLPFRLIMKITWRRTRTMLAALGSLWRGRQGINEYVNKYRHTHTHTHYRLCLWKGHGEQLLKDEEIPDVALVIGLRGAQKQAR